MSADIVGSARLVLLAGVLLAVASGAAGQGSIGPVGPEFQANTYTTSYQRYPAVGPDGAGGFVVVWRSYGSSGTDGSSLSIQAQRYSSAGAVLGTELQVNTYTTSLQLNPAVSPDGAGGFVVVWGSYGSSGTDGSNSSIQAQRYSSAGAALGPEFQVNTYTTSYQANPAVGPDGAGGFVVVWRSRGSSGTDGSYFSIQAQRYSSAGAALGAEFQVNTYTTLTQIYPAVSPDGAGGFVVVWASDGSSGTDGSSFSIQAQRYSSAGAVLGTEFQVNTYTTGIQRFPAVGPDGAGGFVVVWDSGGSSGTDGSSCSIQAQRYSSAGAVLGTEFQVNTYTTSLQLNPAVSPDGAGGFVLVWQSYGSSGTDGSYQSIQAQRYSSAGAVLGTELQVNTYTTSYQLRPAVSPDGAGGFVVVWTSYGSSGTDGSYSSIQAQRFGEPPATPTSTATATSTPTATATSTPTATATSTPTATATSTPTATATSTPTATATSTPTATATSTPTATLPPTSTPTGGVAAGLALALVLALGGLLRRRKT